MLITKPFTLWMPWNLKSNDEKKTHTHTQIWNAASAMDFLIKQHVFELFYVFFRLLFIFYFVISAFFREICQVQQESTHKMMYGISRKNIETHLARFLWPTQAISSNSCVRYVIIAWSNGKRNDNNWIQENMFFNFNEPLNSTNAATLWQVLLERMYTDQHFFMSFAINHQLVSRMFCFCMILITIIGVLFTQFDRFTGYTMKCWHRLNQLDNIARPSSVWLCASMHNNADIIFRR